MFGIGPMELTIIAVVALLIFGPEKLPEMMGQAGKLVRDFRNMTAEMSGEFEKTIAEAKGISKDFQGEVGSMRNQVNSVTKSVQKDLGGGKSTGTSGKKASTTSRRSTSGSSSSKSQSGTKATAARKSGSDKSSGTSKSSSSSSGAVKSTSPKKTDTAAARPAAPKAATREDPTAAISLFEPAEPRRQRRARRATLSAFGDATPRTVSSNGDETASDLAASISDSGEAAARPVDLNDPLVRARQRRQSAGYARKIS